MVYQCVIDHVEFDRLCLLYKAFLCEVRGVDDLSLCNTCGFNSNVRCGRYFFPVYMLRIVIAGPYRRHFAVVIIPAVERFAPVVAESFVDDRLVLGVRGLVKAVCRCYRCGVDGLSVLLACGCSIL